MFSLGLQINRILPQRDSINSYDNFSQIELARRLEQHELLEFRRIAALLYKKNSRWDQSIQLSKQDKLYKEATETAAESGQIETAEEILRYFVDIGAKELYAACLYICYDLVRPDVVAELTWRHALGDFSKPFELQVMREQTSRVSYVSYISSHDGADLMHSRWRRSRRKSSPFQRSRPQRKRRKIPNQSVRR